MNTFVWADLSTYDPKRSIGFYQNVFGWRFLDAGGYHVAMLRDEEIAGLFETPAFFQKLRMPHFWMSYVAVEDAARVADLAKNSEDAKVELTDEFYGGKIALIRDPCGAGFTIYDGGKLNSRRATAGRLAWNELHVSDASRVLPFYERLFGWSAHPGETPGVHHLLNADGEHVTDILEIPNEQKGKYEYWVSTFSVDDVGATRRLVEANGGGVVHNEGNRVLVHDDSGEAFFYLQATGSF